MTALVLENLKLIMLFMLIGSHYWPFAPRGGKANAGAPESGFAATAGLRIGSPLEERKMSVIAHRKNVEIPAAAGQTDRAAIASSVPAIVSFLRKAIGSGARLLMHVVEVIAEARMHRAAIEAELYLNRYKHSSKNDDDLPIVR